MPTVIHELADAFLKRKQALAERGQAKTKLAGSDYFMPKSAKEDLNNRLSVFEQGGLPELLKQAGKEMYENPIVNTAIGFTPGVGDVQAAGETVAALQRGAPWQETAGYAVGMLPFVPALRTTWHGSPHGFTKFDMSKIGTGEGAQAYGHGLYLADAPEVASQYKANRNYIGKALSGNPESVEFNAQKIAQDAADIHGNDALSHLEGVLKANSNSKNKLQIAENQKVADAIELLKQGQVSGSGYLYKVDLPDEQIAKMLDWDKPFSEQPKNVQDAITKYWKENRVYGDPTKLTGEGIYGSLQAHVLGNRGVDRANRSAAQEAASMDLNYMGVPGIQYLDQASRGAGEGTRNYVVFSDEIPKILERNGTSVFEFPKEQITQSLESVNPTGTVFTEYNPSPRATMPLGKNITTLDKTMEVNPSEYVTVYRGVPSGVKDISPGDFITTNQQLAKDYAGNGKVISKRVPASHILDDITEPLGEEYIYRP